MSFLSPSTASSLNHQAEESASVVVFKRWWFTAGGRQEMLPVQHCRLVAGQGEKTGMWKGKIKQISCMWRWVLPLCPNLQLQCEPIWDSLPLILLHQQHEAGHKDLRGISAVSVRRRLQLSLCSEGPWGHTAALAFGPHHLVSPLLAHASVALVAFGSYKIVLEADRNWWLWQTLLKWGYLAENLLSLSGNIFPAEFFFRTFDNAHFQDIFFQCTWQCLKMRNLWNLCFLPV